MEANVDSEGNTRINVDDATARSDLQTLLQETFKEDRALEIMQRLSSSTTYTSILQFYYRSGMTYKEFCQVADKLTTSSETTLPGLVNVNTAPKEVLVCLPGLEEQRRRRPGVLSDDQHQRGEEPNSIAWVTEVLDQTKAVGIGQYITVRSYQYSADIICLSGNGRAYKRYQAVLDTQSTPPRVVYWRSLTHFGWPLQPEIVAALKKGQPLTDVVLEVCIDGT